MINESESLHEDEPSRYVIRVTRWARNEIDQAREFGISGG